MIRKKKVYHDLIVEKAKNVLKINLTQRYVPS
jgi:hypothetical protein